MLIFKHCHNFQTMKISYNWLKDYIQTNLSVTEIAKILTQTGLEVGGIELTEAIKGGLKGVVVGEVKSCIKHPNSDHLNLTSVAIGTEELLPIVCGAPNVAEGQKVMVATVGTKLYSNDEAFTIKKAKLRGEVSMGMICSETELNIGTDSSGIMVLPNDTKIGTTAKEYFDIKEDYTIEIDLTPNRIDGASHIGVARDLAAYMQYKGEKIIYQLPRLDKWEQIATKSPVEIIVETPTLCPRYMGVCLDNIQVAPSPQWLQDRLKTIGLTPINNVVDITNYVLFETGQPLHAFDRAETGNKIIVKTLSEATKFVTLDGVERSLSSDDLMICSDTEPLCIAGVFGGLDSGVKNSTTKIFLESAYFDAVSVRKTARRHGLNTDASFRFERGVDPQMVDYAIQRATKLLKEIAGATVVSNVLDHYPTPIENKKFWISFSQIERLTGIIISKEQIETILDGLEIKIIERKTDSLYIEVPAYRVDVTREADIVEEILRIYGYDNIPVKHQVSSVLSYSTKRDSYALRNQISDYLSNSGFSEIMNNSLSKGAYYTDNEIYPIEKSVVLKNPLSQDLNVMRQTLLYGGLESMLRNINRKRNNLFLYEFGRTYSCNNKVKTENPLDKYIETENLGLFFTGNTQDVSWDTPQQSVSFFYMKAFVLNICKKLGIDIDKIEENYISNNIFGDGLSLKYNKHIIAELGIINQEISNQLEITQTVFFAEINWELILNTKINEIIFKPLAKYPAVRRDFSLLIDKKVCFSEVKRTIMQTERKLLKSVNLFDVYTGDKLPDNKKSYAVSIVLQDENSTLTDKQIEKVSKKVQMNLEKQLGATLR